MDQYILHIDAPFHFRYLVRLTLFDKNNSIPLEGSRYPLTVRLRKGIYTIRLEANGNIRDTTVLLERDERYLIGDEGDKNAGRHLLIAPRMYSSVPLDPRCYASTMDYYITPARFYASLYTREGPSGGSAGSLYLFLRFSSRNKYHELKQDNKAVRSEQFRLLDHMGKELFILSEEQGARVNELDGWIAFNTGLPPGLYLLEYRGAGGRQVPVYVLENLHTQLFLIVNETPLFSSLRIFLQPDRIFDPNDRRNIYTDLLLARLHNNDLATDDGLLEEIRSGMLNSFMLQLLYLYMIAADPGLDPQELFRPGMEQIREDHPYLRGPIPDWRAICVLCGKTYRDRIYTTPISGVPMLNFGYLAIRNAAISDAGLIREKSLNDVIFVSLMLDSPFTTFRPVKIQSSEFHQYRIEEWSGRERSEESVRLMRLLQERGKRESYFENDTGEEQGYSDEAVWQRIMTDTIEDANWLEFVVQDTAKRDNIRSMEEMAWKLQAPLVTITRIFSHIRDNIFAKMMEEKRAAASKPARPAGQAGEKPAGTAAPAPEAPVGVMTRKVQVFIEVENS